MDVAAGGSNGGEEPPEDTNNKKMKYTGHVSSRQIYIWKKKYNGWKT